MRAYIQLADGIRLSPRQYLAALKMAQANPTEKFKQSFRDPSGWMGGNYTGELIVRQHFEMVHDKWASQWPKTGKGNRARKRAQAIHAT
jgi:hypothetical protein